MRGLAFPTAAVSHRESSYDYGTPFSGVGNENAIDPALEEETPIDPALLGDEGYSSNGPVSIPLPATGHEATHMTIRHYPQGPQGDPFAPVPAYIPVEPPSMPVQKPPKKKRKVVREMECGFCQGDDNKNKAGHPEAMLTCSECGRSGHPSCLQLEELEDALRSYPWKCADCKSCEICEQKDGDSNMLICDACDRGWHMGCLQPPLTEEPPGKWYCPACPLPQEPLQSQSEFTESEQLPAEPNNIDPELLAADETFISPVETHRELSVASSSRSAIAPTKSRRKGKGKAVVPVPATDESELDADAGVNGVDYEQTPVTASRRRTKVKSRWKGKLSAKNGDESGLDTPTDHDNLQPSPIKRIRLRRPSPPSSPHPPVRIKILPPKGKGKEREHDDGEDGEDGAKKGMFDELLSPEDRDIGQTTITLGDKTRFEKARVAGDHKFNPQPPSLPLHLHRNTSEIPDTPVAGPSTRRSTLLHIPIPPPTPGPATSPAPSTPADTSGPSTESALRIRSIRFGEYDIQTWYNAPFPEEYANLPDGRLWICEFCLKYMKSRFVAVRHQLKCKMRHPPGDEIYRDGPISIFEVDGRKNKIYCQNLCLLSKMFLDHKSLFYDVEPFLFYVITEVDDMGARFVGYFSKEKRSPKDYNVSCIMTLPVRQRQGWGNLLIDFSYLLSKKERRAGSPEKPLSALGALGYKNYWTLALMRYLRTGPRNPKLQDISAATSMTLEDIYVTLVQQNMINIVDAGPSPKPLPGQTIRFPKGRKNGIARKHLQRTNTQDDDRAAGPFVPPRSYKIRWDPLRVEEYMRKWEAKGYLKLKPDCLKWSPFLIARTPKSDGVVTTAEDGTEQPISPLEEESQAEELDSPGAGPSNGLGTTNSPLAALFDDEGEVESTPVTKRRSPRKRAESDVGRNVEDEEEIRSLRTSPRKRTQPDILPRRTRRQSSFTVLSTPSSKKSPNALVRRQSSTTLRRRRSTIRVPQAEDDAAPMTPEDRLAQDAALAAKLAMEEGRPRTRLRSHSNHELDFKSVLTPRTRPQPPTRKRRRAEMESSLEPELSSPPETPRIQTRRSSALANQVKNSPFSNKRSSVKRPTATPISRQNSRSARASRRIRSPTASHASESEREVPARREEEEEEEEEELAPRQPTHEAELRLEGSREDVKSEAVDTPLTNTISRHSAPSDDTTCVPEEQRDVAKGTTPAHVVEAASLRAEAGNGIDRNLRREEEEEEERPQKATPILVNSLMTTEPDAIIVDDLDGDADAEGDPDIDAEGDDDIDAEGEPDEDVEYEVL